MVESVLLFPMLHGDVVSVVAVFVMLAWVVVACKLWADS